MFGVIRGDIFGPFQLETAFYDPILIIWARFRPKYTRRTRQMTEEQYRLAVCTTAHTLNRPWGPFLAPFLLRSPLPPAMSAAEDAEAAAGAAPAAAELIDAEMLESPPRGSTAIPERENPQDTAKEEGPGDHDTSNSQQGQLVPLTHPFLILVVMNVAKGVRIARRIPLELLERRRWSRDCVGRRQGAKAHGGAKKGGPSSLKALNDVRTPISPVDSLGNDRPSLCRQ